MDLSGLKKAIDEAILVDAHAHKLVANDSTFPFINCFSQSSLNNVHDSISFKKNLREMAELYDCKPSLHGIEEHRKSLGLESICSTCFKAARISAILIDDGLNLDKTHNIEWHKKIVPTVGRIVTIECLADNILNEEFQGGSSWTLDAFTQTFLSQLKSLAHEIHGLKSIAACRSGLQINVDVSRNDVEEGLVEVLKGEKPVRIENKSLIDYIFIHSLEIAQHFNLPIQIHTGLGDKDGDFGLANPLHLRTVLNDKRFSKCYIVLLHASFPFPKEASHLASIYSQVYLDFGLPVSNFSVHGMIFALKQLLELAPIKKVMFSTSGCAFPETYYLGAKKSKDVVFSVLRDACIDNDLSILEAIEAVKDIFARNAMKLYKINPTKESCIQNASKTSIHSMNTNGYSKESDIQNGSITSICSVQKNDRLVRIIWVDTPGKHRCRAVPYNRFHEVAARNGVGMASFCMAMGSINERPADGSGLSVVGEVKLMPDLSTKRTIPWNNQGEMVLADMYLRPGEVWEYCPRGALRRISKILKQEFDLEIKAGFEIEFYLLKKEMRDGKEDWVPFYPVTTYCSSASFEAASTFLHEVIASLNSLNIAVEQLHAESGTGQYEFAVEYKNCLNAVDDLIYTREVIRAVATKHGFLATFMPKYAMDVSGSGLHVHLSLWKNGKNVFMASDSSSKHGMSTIGEEFMAGVLHHISSILAFTAPVPNSYDRIQPNRCCGTYQCWGKDNREAPLRTACPPGIAGGLVSNFEMRIFDGCANPYLGLAAILSAGLDGLRNHIPLPEPTEIDPHSMIDPNLQRMPKSLLESVEALEKNKNLTDLLGEKLVVAVKAVRKAEVEYYSKNPDAYKQLIYRY